MMKTDQAKKSVLKLDSETQQENVKNIRKGLKTIQSAALDKENAKNYMIKTSKSNFNEPQKPKTTYSHKETQTEPDIFVIDDLTSDSEPSASYWKKLAETRQESLNNSCLENEILKDSIHALQEENKACKEMLDESRNLVEVLREILNESNDESTANEDNQEEDLQQNSLENEN